MTGWLPQRLAEHARAEGIEIPGVGALVHDQDRILIVRRSAHDDFLPGIEELPSGGVGPSETLEQALDRELAEEIDFPAGRVDLGWIATFDYSSSTGRPVRQLTVSVPLDGRTVRLSDEHDRLRWVGAGELDATSLTTETRGVVDAWFATRPDRPVVAGRPG